MVTFSAWPGFSQRSLLSGCFFGQLCPLLLQLCGQLSQFLTLAEQVAVHGFRVSADGVCLCQPSGCQFPILLKSLSVG